MRRALAALTLLFAFLLCFAGTASAYVDVGAKNRVGDFGDPFGDCAGFDGLQALDTHQEITILCYDPATDVWFYVRQNPWTHFDPLGLQTGRKYTPAQAAAKRAQRERFYNSSGGKIYKGVGLTVGGFIPYVGDSLDVVDAVSPSSSGLDRGIAGASLTVNAATGGLAPNAGPVVKGVKHIGEGIVEGVQGLFRGADEVADTARGTREATEQTVEAVTDSPVIIGENMKRVNQYSENVGGTTIDDWLDGREWSQELNDEFIATMKSQGREIKDIGPDFKRRRRNRVDPSEGKPPSEVYGTERRELQDYDNYEQLYERSSKYQGGVPDFDK